MEIQLAGEVISLSAVDAGSLFSRPFDDIETTLSAQRFAWLPALGEGNGPKWAAHFWSLWRKDFIAIDGGWAWHPYTAAERAANLIDYSRFHRNETLFPGLEEVLGMHARKIMGALEYFGDHDTSNHLANNGRGLYRIGLRLRDDKISAVGLSILVHEADRIFTDSGILREESTHYHALYAQRYADVWLDAERHGRPERHDLARIAQKALSVLPQLVMNDRFPLVGDISPDFTPEYLSGLWRKGAAARGWVGSLTEQERGDLACLCDSAPAPNRQLLMKAGWLKLDKAPWTGFWHCPVAGWRAMPGHGHHDIGGFELNYSGMALFVDPGRDRYGNSLEDQIYCRAEAHSSLTLNNHEPYPPNKPYYDDAFRRTVCGPPPELYLIDGGAGVRFCGYSRFRNMGCVERNWQFSGTAVMISDVIRGRRTVDLTRRLQTGIKPRQSNGAVILEAGQYQFRIIPPSGTRIKIAESPLWTAYGNDVPGWRIQFDQSVRLPHESAIVVEAA